MVRIDKVKMRLLLLSSAHVSHFFGKGSVGKERMDTFCSFSTLRQLTVASSAPVFGPRVALSAPFRRIFGKFRHLDATSGSYREALWPPGCSFGAISAPGCNFGQLQGSALATWMRFWRPVGTWMPLRKDLRKRCRFRKAPNRSRESRSRNIFRLGPPAHIF